VLVSLLPVRLSVLDGHFTYFDSRALAAADRILRRISETQDRFVLATASRLSAAFPSARNTYVLSGALPLDLYELPRDATLDTAVEPVYGVSALRIHVHNRPTGMSGVTSGDTYVVVSRLEDGLRVQLKGSLDSCLESLRKQGLEISSIEWESVSQGS
jgi:hypothetical protein